MFFDALRGCPGQALIKHSEIDALLLGFFQSRRQFLASFHRGILALPEEKQEDGVGEAKGSEFIMIASDHQKARTKVSRQLRSSQRSRHGIGQFSLTHFSAQPLFSGHNEQLFTRIIGLPNAAPSAAWCVFSATSALPRVSGQLRTFPLR